jgi:hypothetical protein
MQAAMAVATQRVRVGCLVTGNTYRNPAVLAKLAVTVDHLSGGRLEFGIGAAWAEVEHSMYRIEGLDHRVGRLSESLQILRSLWTSRARRSLAGTTECAMRYAIQKRFTSRIRQSGSEPAATEPSDSLRPTRTCGTHLLHCKQCRIWPALQPGSMSYAVRLVEIYPPYDGQFDTRGIALAVRSRWTQRATGPGADSPSRSFCYRKRTRFAWPLLPLKRSTTCGLSGCNSSAGC